MASWIKDKGKNLLGNVDEIEVLTQVINELSGEQRKAIEIFNRAMNDFATERSVESCLDALNASMQIANIRGKLVESYEYYARMLEQEVTALMRNREKTSGSSKQGPKQI